MKRTDATPIHYTNLQEDREYVLKANGMAVVKLLKKEKAGWLFEIVDGELSVGGKPKRKTARVTIGAMQLPMANFYERA